MASSAERAQRARHGRADPETHLFADDGVFPNSRLPVLIYRGVLRDAERGRVRAACSRRTAGRPRGETASTRCTTTTAPRTRCWASTTAASPRASAASAAASVTLVAGDVVVIPAGVAHKNDGASADFRVVGAYPRRHVARHAVRQAGRAPGHRSQHRARRRSPPAIRCAAAAARSPRCGRRSDAPRVQATRSRWAAPARSGSRARSSRAPMPRQKTCHSGKRAKPSHCFAYQALIGFAGARPPEEAREVARQQRPQLAADAFALRLPLDGELGQVGRDRASPARPPRPSSSPRRRCAPAAARRSRRAPAARTPTRTAPRCARGRCRPSVVWTSMREPRRISVPAPLTVNSSRSSCSGLTTVTLNRCGTDSTSCLTCRSSIACPRGSAPGASSRCVSVGQADHRQDRAAVGRQARPPAQEHQLARLQRRDQRREHAEARLGRQLLASPPATPAGSRRARRWRGSRRSVSAPTRRRPPSRARPRRARRLRAATPTRASPARRRPWARAGRAPPPAAGPAPPGCADRSAADRARSSRSARWAPASRSSPCAARGAGAGTDRCRPWRRRSRGSAGRSLLPSPQHVRERGRGPSRARRSRRTRRRRAPARRRPDRTRPRRSRARTAATPRSSTPRSTASAMRAPSSGSKPAMSRGCSDGLAIVTDQAIGVGRRRGAHAALGLGQQSPRRGRPAPGAAKTSASRAWERR